MSKQGLQLVLVQKTISFGYLAVSARVSEFQTQTKQTHC